MDPIEAAAKRMRSVDLSYMPVYPGGQKQFDVDCQVLAAAYLNERKHLPTSEAGGELPVMPVMHAPPKLEIPCPACGKPTRNDHENYWCVYCKAMWDLPPHTLAAPPVQEGEGVGR